MAAWTLAQLDAIERAIAGGYLKVKYEDREVTFRSLDELLRLRASMMLFLGLSTGGRSFTLSSYRKGTTP